MKELPDQTNDLPRELAPPRIDIVRKESSRAKIERIASESKGLVDDVKEWVDLRLKLVKTEVQAEVSEKMNDVVQDVLPIAVPAVIVAVGVLFLLVTAALGIGWWLGRPFWGFLVVTGLLFFVALVARRVLLRKQKAHKHKRIEAAPAAE